MNLLDHIHSPADLKKLSPEELPRLCSEIRAFMLDTISGTGGHLSSNLGSVELTVALHYVFDSPNDKFIWDVGHQTYTHKILTGRKDALPTIRKTGGLSGFPRKDESKHDHYNAGHAGTSISQSIGEAIAQSILHPKSQKKRSMISIIGDASIATGMAFEALNHGGHLKIPFLVILNDNEMSISKNIGALSYMLTSMINTSIYKKWMYRWARFIRSLPLIGVISERMLKRMGSNMKSIITEHQFFQELGFRYLGPLDGHDVIKLVNMLKKLKSIEVPSLLHVVTKKGKGYEPAEKDPTAFHGVGPFDLKTGAIRKEEEMWSFSNFVGNVLCELAKKDKKICVVTPAMTEGSGLTRFAAEFPDRFFDTGISEQHAATMSAALANAGLKPYLCIYSTFLQRAYDQLIHDIALMNQPVRLVVDRAGAVGADGETHQGLLDIGMFSAIPGLRLLSAANAKELMDMIAYMKDDDKSPIAVRFPKASFEKSIFDDWVKQNRKTAQGKFYSPFEPQSLRKGKDILIFSEGLMNHTALEAAGKLEKEGISASVVSLRCIYPIDHKKLLPYFSSMKECQGVFVIENHISQNGLASQMKIALAAELEGKLFHSFSYPTPFIEHGSVPDLEKKYGLDAEHIFTSIRRLVNSRQKKAANY